MTKPDDSPHLADALDAIKAVEALDADLCAARHRRDLALYAMHNDDGLSFGKVAQLTGMSRSFVKLVDERLAPRIPG